MRPDKDNTVLGVVGDRPEGVWLPWRDLVRWIGRRPNGVGKGVPVGRADTTSKDLGGLGLLEVEMERGNLKPLPQLNVAGKNGIVVGVVEHGPFTVPEDGLCLSCTVGGHACMSLASKRYALRVSAQIKHI